MHRMKLLSLRKMTMLVAVAALIAGAMIALAPAEDSEAQTRCGTEIRFFSDPGLTQQVGAYIWTPEACGCHFFSWGDVSLYREILDSDC